MVGDNHVHHDDEIAPLLSNAAHADTAIIKCPDAEDIEDPEFLHHEAPVDDDNHPDDHEDHPNVVLNFFRRVAAIKGVIITAFIIGASNGIVASISQDLKYDAFGDNMYIIAGSFGSAKSLLQYMYMPLMGAVSDVHGRYYCLIASMSASALPFIAFLVAGENFWAYSIANIVFGSYGASLALTMMVTLDTLPRKDQTAGFSAVMASFLVGIGGTSFLNGILNGALLLFAISAGAQVVGVLVVIFMVPNKPPGWKRALLKQKRLEAQKASAEKASAGKVTECPVSGAPVTIGGECPVERNRGDADNAPTPAQPASYLNVNNNRNSALPEVGSKATGVDASTVEFHKGMTSAELDKIDPMSITVDNIRKLSAGKKLSVYFRRVKHVVKLHPKVLILCGVVFWNYMTEMMLEEMLLMYLMMDPRDYTMMDLNIVLAVMSAAGVIGLLFFIDPMRKLMNDMWLLRASLLANCAMTVLYAFVQNTWQGFTLPIFSIVGMAAYPAVCAVAAYIAGDNTFGVVNGLLGATRQISGLISPFIYGVMFQSSMNSSFPGWPFIAGGASLLFGLVTTFFIKYDAKKATPSLASQKK